MSADDTYLADALRIIEMSASIPTLDTHTPRGGGGGGCSTSFAPTSTCLEARGRGVHGGGCGGGDRDVTKVEVGVGGAKGVGGVLVQMEEEDTCVLVQMEEEGLVLEEEGVAVGAGTGVGGGDGGGEWGAGSREGVCVTNGGSTVHAEAGACGEVGGEQCGGGDEGKGPTPGGVCHGARGGGATVGERGESAGALVLGENEREIEAVVRAYLEDLKILELVSIKWMDSKVCASASMITSSEPGGLIKGTLHLVKGRAMSQNRLMCLLHHEIGTHYVRALNHHLRGLRPPGAKNGCLIKGLALRELITEEGLATLNTLLASDSLSLSSPALSYYAQCRAMHLGFTDLFLELGERVPHLTSTVRWAYCFRSKRGLRDTSIAGAFGKDRAYLEGAIRILQQRDSLDFRILHAGKVSLEDYEEARRHGPPLRDNLRASCTPLLGAGSHVSGPPRGTRRQDENLQVRIPHFLRNEKHYRARLDSIAAANGIAQANGIAEANGKQPLGIHLLAVAARAGLPASSTPAAAASMPYNPVNRIRRTLALTANECASASTTTTSSSSSNFCAATTGGDLWGGGGGGGVVPLRTHAARPLRTDAASEVLPLRTHATDLLQVTQILNPKTLNPKNQYSGFI